MTPTAEARPAAAPPRRRRWRRVGVVLLAIVAVAGLVLWLLATLGSRRLKDALAEADRLDPGWRCEELEAKRAAVPDAENGALRVQEAGKLLGTWQPAALAPDLAFIKGLAQDKPGGPLEPEVQAALVQAYEAAPPSALDAARALKDYPRGRYPAVIAGPERVLVSTADYDVMHRLGTLLAYDALRRAADGDADAAMESCRAMLNVFRSLGDDPNFFQHHLVTAQAAVCGVAEQVLGRIEPSPTALAALQSQLEEVAADPLSLRSARSFRAQTDRMLEALANGEVGPAGPERLLVAPVAVNGRSELLHAMNQLVEITKLPVDEQPKAIAERLPGERDFSILGRIYLLPKLQATAGQLSVAARLSQAELRCAIAALAAERFRIARGNWPADLDALAPEFLREVPPDPYDGQPLRVRRTAGGLVIYSVGPDGTDNGGTIHLLRPPPPAGTDVGFRLRDPDERGRP